MPSEAMTAEQSFTFAACAAAIPILAYVYTARTVLFDNSKVADTYEEQEDGEEHALNRMKAREISLGQCYPLFFGWVSLILVGAFQLDFDLTLWVLLGFCVFCSLVNSWQITTRVMMMRAKWKEDRTIMPTQATPLDVYQELSAGALPLKTMYIAIAQGLLFVYYVHHVWHTVPDWSKQDTFQYYFAGVWIQIALMYNAGGIWCCDISEDCDYWAFIGVVAECNVSKLRYTDIRRYIGAWKPNKWTILTRFAAAKLVNVVGATFIFMTLPLLLSSSETKLDFVLNCSATVFIVELDDLSGSAPMEIEVSGAGPPPWEKKASASETAPPAVLSEGVTKDGVEDFAELSSQQQLQHLKPTQLPPIQ